MTAPPAATPAAPTRRTSATNSTRAAPLGGGPLQAAVAIALCACCLAWPAALNRFPILFSDTGGFLEMGFLPSLGWDKPFVYGPFLALLSLGRTLWLPLAAQAVALSYLLFLVQACVGPSRPGLHLLLCLTLGAGTAAPWITSTLMPDVCTPMVVLGVAVASFARPTRAHAIAAGTLTALAVAAHLSHLIVAAACIGAATLLRGRLPWRAVASLAAAVVFLLASNAVGHRRPGISPYGSVFALARLIGDGPARDYLDHVCPQAGYRLCAWRDQLTADSDQFLWDPQSPFWRDPAPLAEFADEAAAIVRATVLTYPARVLRDAIRNAARQLGHFQLGDTLVPDYLNEAVLPRLARWLPDDARRYEAGLQVRGELAEKASFLRPLHEAVLALAALGCAAILIRALRRPAPLAGLAALILIGLAANALATGALSTVHDRYQARIAWLLALPPLLALTPCRGRTAVPTPSPSGRESG